MHDLNTINRLNYETWAGSIQNFRAQGRFVVATYDGLTLMGIETFTTRADAELAMAEGRGSASTTRKLFDPIPPEQVVGSRDQLEDRVPDPHKTLTGYINRIQGDDAA